MITHYLSHVTGYQPIRDQYLRIRSVPAKHSPLLQLNSHHQHGSLQQQVRPETNYKCYNAAAAMLGGVIESNLRILHRISLSLRSHTDTIGQRIAVKEYFYEIYVREVDTTV